MRQDDGAPDGRGPRGADERRHPDRRSRRERRAAKGPRHRDGLPELRALPAHERVRQPRLRPEAPRHREGRDRSARQRRRRGPRHRSPAPTETEGALGRSASARRGRPRHRSRAGRLPDGRAALQSRRRAPDPDARRIAEAPPADPADDDLRDARSGGSDDDGGPHRRHEGRTPSAARHAAGAARAARESLRRGIHRVTRDELLSREAGPRRGRDLRGCRFLPRARLRVRRALGWARRDRGSAAGGHRRSDDPRRGRARERASARRCERRGRRIPWQRVPATPARGGGHDLRRARVDGHADPARCADPARIRRPQGACVRSGDGGGTAMTLRGSVASFPLETVVQLLAATAKTGQLEVRSGRESGSLGFAEGRLVSAVTGDESGDAALGAVFRMSDGEFEFVPCGDPPDANLTGDLSQLLDRAVVQRDKIVADRQVISDDRLRFGLSDRGGAQGEVRLSAEQWRALLAVNGERDLLGIAQTLRLGRLATLAMLADLVRAGSVEVPDAPPERPSGPGPGPSGGGAGSETPSFTAAPPVREWDRPRADARSDTVIDEPATAEPAFVAPAVFPTLTPLAPEREAEPEAAAAEPELDPEEREPAAFIERELAGTGERRPAAAPERGPAAPVEREPSAAGEREPSAAAEREPAAAVEREAAAVEREPAAAVEREPEPKIAAAWEQPPPIPPRETQVWGEPSIAQTPVWEKPARPAGEPEKPSWDNWDSPTPATPAEPTPAAPPPPATWDAPLEQTRAWQPSAEPTATEREWGVPAQEWEKPAPAHGGAKGSVRADTARHDAAPKETVADRGGALEGKDTAAPAADRTMDERLSALSGLFGTPAAQPAAPSWPADESRATTSGAPAAVPPHAPPAEEPKKKGGLFSGLFKKDDTRKDEIQARLATATAPAVQSGPRLTKDRKSVV